jgi:hypothetical protein
MFKRTLIAIPLLLLGLGLTGCHSFWELVVHDNFVDTPGEAAATAEQTPVGSQSSTIEDYVSLVEALRAEGAVIEPKGDISQVFFSVPGVLISVNGEDVQVFEFPDEESAETEAATISPDGSSTPTTMITWIAPPHFFKNSGVIVLYVGTNEAVVALLERVLGPQFAGR